MKDYKYGRRKRMTEQKKEVLIIIIGIVVLFGTIAGFGLYHRSQFTENEPYLGDWKFDVSDEIVFTGGRWEGHHAVVLDGGHHTWPGGGGMGITKRAYLLKLDSGAERWLSEFQADGYAKKLKPD